MGVKSGLNFWSNTAQRLVLIDLYILFWSDRKYWLWKLIKNSRKRPKRYFFVQFDCFRWRSWQNDLKTIFLIFELSETFAISFNQELWWFCRIYVWPRRLRKNFSKSSSLAKTFENAWKSLRLVLFLPMAGKPVKSSFDVNSFEPTSRTSPFWM